MISDNDFRQGEDQPELVAWAQQEPPIPASLPTEEIAGLLESLVSKSLVRLTERSEPPRFMLLETIREYALERLAESGEERYLTDRISATLRTQLDPKLLETGWAEGQALSLEQAIVEALEVSRDALRDDG